MELHNAGCHSETRLNFMKLKTSQCLTCMSGISTVLLFFSKVNANAVSCLDAFKSGS